MNTPRRSAFVLALTDRLRMRGSWAGETHLQKATYFLQVLAGVPLDFHFILYKHGPFSFDLRDELSSLRADGLVDIELRPYPYGPTLTVTETGRDLEKRYAANPFHAKVDFIADRLGQKRVGELEQLATALYVRATEPGLSVEERAKRIVEYKPHVGLKDALLAVENVEGFAQELTAVQ